MPRWASSREAARAEARRSSSSSALGAPHESVPVRRPGFRVGAAALVLLAAVADAAAGPAFDGARAYRDVERLVAFGPRPPGSPALERARGYLAGELRHAGWRVREHAFTAHTPRGTLRMVNLVG